MDLNTELELVTTAKQGLKGFERLYEHYYPRIYFFCLNRVFNKELAEDITSETFLAALKQLQDFDTSRGVRFGAWLYRVANNKIVDYIRKHKNKIVVDFDPDRLKSDAIDHDEAVRKFELQGHIAAVLKELKPRYQEMISYRFYAELSNEEIAGLLNMRINQVAVVLHRALKSFKEKFTKKYPDSEIFDLN